jgi:hypothetical protein
MSNQPLTINLIVQSGPNPGQTFAVQDRPQTIGRSLSNDIAIPEPSLSRQHARISATPGGFIIEDLGSANGTFVNGQPVTGPTPLRPGDTLQLGGMVTFSVQPGQPDQDATYVPGASPGRPDRTLVPGAPSAPLPAPVYAPPARRSSPWIWVGVIVVTILAVGGIIGGLYYYLTVLSVPPTPAPAEIPQTPMATEAQPAQVEPTPTATPAPTATPSQSPEPIEIVVGGVPAAAAQEREVPQDISNQVDPFCNGEIEIKADEPILISWQRRVADDDETDYLAQWLEAAYYDIRLGGRPITDLGTFHYQRGESCDQSGLCGPTLTWWINVGLLEAGTHYLTLEWYTDRAISNGLDVEPADGEVDLFGPGPAGEGFCEIIVVETVTPTPEATATPTASPTATPTAISTPKPVATSTPVVPAPLGIFQDFEKASTWKRGDQPYGELNQAHSGSYAGQLTYDFPTPDNDYVVFSQSRRLAGRPNAISAWVSGDGSGHFLNIWIKDAAGQTWQMTFGQVKHTGWQEMTAFLDPGQPWPSGHISGPDNGAIDYPISFQALVLDDGSDGYSGRGTIYIDDLNSQEGAAPPIPTPFTGAPTPTSGGQPAPSVSGIYVLSIGSQHRYEEPWGAPKGGDPCEAWVTDNWDDENPNFRGFNVELLLTNNSTTKVQDDWGENMRFFTAGGQEVIACYYGYAGAGPPPGGTTSLTFFTVVPKGDFVQTIQLNLNGQLIQICLDGRGGWSPC